MKTESYISELSKLLTEYESLDRKKLFRDDLGEKGIRKETESLFDEFIEKLRLTKSYVGKIEDSYVFGFIKELQELKTNMLSWASQGDADFVARRGDYVNSINQRYQAVLSKWGLIITCILDSERILNSLKDYRELTNESIKEIEETKKTIDNIKISALNEIREQANEIKKSAQKTARNISVKAAQDQFDVACKKFRKSIWIWTGITCLMVLVFGVLSYNFYFHSFFTLSMKNNSIDFGDKFIDILRWESIYHTIIRVSILAVVGTIIAFCLKMLRGNLHMFQHNLHRQRVANSLEAFVNAALTDEQSDRILEKLVEAVVSFGQSGLIQNEDDSIHASKLTIDSISKTLTSK